MSDLEYLHDLVTKIDSRLDDMAETLVRHDENLKQHMKRSDAAEQQLELLKKHVNQFNGIGAFIGLLALIATIWAAVK